VHVIYCFDLLKARFFNKPGKLDNSNIGRNSKIARFTSGHSKIATISKVIEI